ncbi:MAG: NAD-dependent epimerase/dehydratase family protein [Planctomycetes bacterium]|nr:NAD-dependent epimerase/dehydratase family protein [Planctomycetota bacterium]
MKALVTGGGGFLGSCVVRMLRDRGDDVTAFGRRRYSHLDALGIDTVQGDLRDAQVVREACRGMDVIFHVAALAGIWGTRRAYWETNVTGTANVLDACRANGVRKLVYTSSPSVVFGNQPLCGVDESQPYPSRFPAHYPASKAAAEQMVLGANGDDLATVALRPHLIWGPGDPHLLPRVVERAKRGKLLQVGDGDNRVDITYIDNAAEAHLLAAEALENSKPCAGRAFFISQGEPVLLWPWLNQMLEAAGAPPVTRSISHAKARKVGAVLETIHRLLHLSREPRMTRFLADQLAESHYFDISAAERELGYRPRISTAEGMKRWAASLSDTP